MPPAKPKRVFLAIDELSPTPDEASCFKFHDDHWWRYRVPSHHLVLLESGRIEAKTPDGRFRGTAGDLFCFRPTDWNEYGCFGDTVFYQAHMEFAPPPKQKYTPMLGELGPMPIHLSLGPAFEAMRRVFEVLCMEISQPGALHQLRLRSVIHEMLAIIVGVLSGQHRAPPHVDEWQRLRLRMEADLKTNLAVMQLARQMRLSRPYFARAFKARFGMAPKQFQTIARLREAMRLLRSGEQSVKAVAYEVGFRDPKLFARVCKRHLGVLPSDLRLNPVKFAEPPSTTAGLFPLNTHMLPPKTPANWMDAYFPPG